MPSTSAHPLADRTVFGIGIAFIAFLTLSSADALTKLLSQRYSVFELAVVDAVVALAILLPIFIRDGGVASLMPKRPGIVILRCLFGAGSLMLCFLAFAAIPLAQGYAIAFLTPLAVTALAAPVLGEHVGWRQWLAVVIGFAAVIVILRPEFNGAGIGQFYMLASAALFALSMLVLRRIAKTETSGALMTVYFIMLFLIALPVALAQWSMPSAADLGLMVLLGVGSGVGNLLLIVAFRYAAAALVSSFMYSQLIWGTVFGAILFNDLPDLITIGGAAIIMLCGIYTLTHASRAARVGIGA